jgi:hypothetical protein
MPKSGLAPLSMTCCLIFSMAVKEKLGSPGPLLRKTPSNAATNTKYFFQTSAYNGVKCAIIY